MDSLTKPAISRLIKESISGKHRYADKLQISSLIYEEVRTHLKNYTENIVRQIFMAMQHSQATVMLEKHVYLAIEKIPASNTILEQCKENDNKKGIACFYFPKASFKRFLQNIAQDYFDRLKYSEKALNLIQSVCEEYLKNMVIEAALSTFHSGRTTLFPKDIQLARRLGDSDIHHSLKLIKTVDYKTYIKSVSKMINKDITISEEGKTQLNTMLNLLGQAIVKQCNELLLVKGSSTIDSKTMQASVRMVFNGELAKHAVSAASKSVLKKETHKSSNKVKNNRLESKCGLIFSVSRTRNLIETYTKHRISSNTSIYLAAVLEYVTAELLELSGSAAEGEKKKTITGRMLKRASDEDEEISILIRSLGMNFV